jgi:hypothetical protein
MFGTMTARAGFREPRENVPIRWRLRNALLRRGREISCVFAKESAKRQIKNKYRQNYINLGFVFTAALYRRLATAPIERLSAESRLISMTKQCPVAPRRSGLVHIPQRVCLSSPLAAGASWAWRRRRVRIIIASRITTAG